MKVISVITCYKCRIQVLSSQAGLLTLSNTLTHFKMRRTTHFYLMVMSSFLLRLKGARTDFTECNQRFDAAHTWHNYSQISGPLHSESSFAKQGLISGKITDAEIIGLKNSDDVLKIFEQTTRIVASDLNTETPQNPSVQIVGTMRSFVSSSRSVVRAVRDSRNDNRRERNGVRRETRRKIQILPVNRREVAERRTASRNRNEIRLRRNVRMNEIKCLSRRQGFYNRQDRCTTTRLNASSHPRKEGINTRRENQDLERRQEIFKRYEIVDGRYNARRNNQRNADSAETRGQERKGHILIRNSYLESRERNTVGLQQRRSRQDMHKNNVQLSNRRREIVSIRSHRNIDRRSSQVPFHVEALSRSRRAEDGINRRSNIFPRSKHNIHYALRKLEFHQTLPELNKVTEERRLTGRRENRELIRSKETYSGRRENRDMIRNKETYSGRRENRDMIRSKETYSGRRENRDMIRNKETYTGRRENRDIIRFTETYTGRRENRDMIRSKETYSSRRTREHIRQTDNSRRMQSKNNRVTGFGITSYSNNWIWSESGITRAVVVGFVGILGRRLWQKQA